MDQLSTNQWIVIAVIFGVGLVLGLMLRSGGSKWRRLYEAEHDAHMRLRLDYDRLYKTATVAQVEHNTLKAGSF